MSKKKFVSALLALVLGLNLFWACDTSSKDKLFNLTCATSKTITMDEVFLVSYQKLQADAVITITTNSGDFNSASNVFTPTQTGSVIITVVGLLGEQRQTEVIILTVTAGAVQEPTSIALDRSALTLAPAGYYTLQATVNDGSAVTWSSSNNSIATVTDGTVIAVAVGTATITATANGVSATCVVTVTMDEPSIPTTISLNKTTLSLQPTQSYTLVATLNDGSTVAWSSSNTSVATVANGVVSAVAVGTATITATANGVSATCVVTVSSGSVDTTISLNQPTVTLEPSQSFTLIATVNDGSTVAWSSSATNIATVANGVVSAVAVGTATITATANGVSATCVVTVVAPQTEDTTAPVITTTDCSTSYLAGVGVMLHATAYDAVDGSNITLEYSSTTGSINNHASGGKYYLQNSGTGSAKVTVTATDRSNNTSTKDINMSSGNDIFGFNVSPAITGAIVAKDKIYFNNLSNDGGTLDGRLNIVPSDSSFELSFKYTLIQQATGTNAANSALWISMWCGGNAYDDIRLLSSGQVEYFNTRVGHNQAFNPNTEYDVKIERKEVSGAWHMIVSVDGAQVADFTTSNSGAVQNIMFFTNYANNAVGALKTKAIGDDPIIVEPGDVDDPLSLTYPTKTIPSGKYSIMGVSESNPTASTWGYVNTHDPSIFKDPNSSWYYAYSTDANYGATYQGGIHIRKSQDLVSWQWVGTAFNRNFPAPATAHVAPNAGSGYTFWAPDIIYLNGKYLLYYCVSAFGSTQSYMGVAESSSPEGPFVHKSEIYKSNRDTGMSANAIDPNLIWDDEGNLWCSYGSFFGGIYIKRLNNTTGYALNISETGTRIAGGNGIALEGPYIVREGNYYYLFVSYGDLNSDYNVRVFRCAVSDGVNGTYKDAKGQSATSLNGSTFRQYGNKILGAFKFSGDSRGLYAPGHMSILKDGGKYFMVHHTRLTDRETWQFFINVRQMYFNVDGWPVLNPNEYVGETLQNMSSGNVYGSYDAVRTVASAAADAAATNSQKMALNGDGTVSGSFGSGTWSVSGNSITITVGGDTYKGIVTVAKNQSGQNVISFSAVSSTSGTHLFGNKAA